MNPSSSASNPHNPKLKEGVKMPSEPLTIDLHRFTLKSSKDSTSIPKKKKEAHSTLNTKTPISEHMKDLNRRQKSLRLSTEVISIKELGKKNHTQTTTSHIATKVCEPKAISVLHGKNEIKYYNDAFKRRLSNKIEEKETSLNPNLMKEPPKKVSVPTTLALTLNNINANVGSSSYRTQLFSPNSDASPVNNGLLRAFLNRASKSPELRKEKDFECGRSNLSIIKTFKSFQGEINNVSDELALNSTKPYSNNGVENTSSVYVHSEPNDSLPLSKESNARSSHHKNLSYFLNGKEVKSKRALYSAKSKPLSSNLSHEIESINKTKGTLENKDKTIEYVQTLPDETTAEFYDIKSELEKDRVTFYKGKINSTRSHLFTNRRLSSQPSPKNVEDVRKLVKQLNKLGNGPEQASSDSFGLKTSLLENNAKDYPIAQTVALNSRLGVSPKNRPKDQDNLKKLNNYLYSTSSNPVFAERGEEAQPQRKQSLKDSQIFQDYIKKTKKGQKGSFNNIPEEMSLSFNKVNRSHCPKASFDRSFEILSNRQLTQEGMSTSPYTDKDTSRDNNLDIGKALNGLKDKLKRVLKNYAHDRKTLKEVSEILMQTGSRLFSS